MEVEAEVEVEVEVEAEVVDYTRIELVLCVGELFVLRLSSLEAAQYVQYWARGVVAPLADRCLPPLLCCRTQHSNQRADQQEELLLGKVAFGGLVEVLRLELAHVPGSRFSREGSQLNLP